MKPGMRQLVEDAEVWSLEALLCLRPSASLDQMQIHTAGVLTPNQWRSSHRESSQFNPVQLAGLRPAGRAHGAGDPGRHGGALCRGHLWEMPTSFLQCLSVNKYRKTRKQGTADPWCKTTTNSETRKGIGGLSDVNLEDPPSSSLFSKRSAGAALSRHHLWLPECARSNAVPLHNSPGTPALP
ncbi:hypothetical protein MG293_011548 [Ovis ammon polii]|uniref:Uncharacterized protein n=1 Tax=Ovis ammon polii TaxID=230172 RepID=A0AAD4U6M9_OVIAM|nr:hypothetical protein MG293_011548 [Ovis ammon polii]